MSRSGKRGTRTGLTRRDVSLGLLAAAAATLPGSAWAGFFDFGERQQPQAPQQAEMSEGFDVGTRRVPRPRSNVATLGAPTVEATELAYQRYSQLVQSGGWAPVPGGLELKIGMRHPNVVALRRRLMAEDDLPANTGVSDIFDSYVDAAVRRFQVRYGLQSDGVVRQVTLDAMNVPAIVRLRQMETNLVRLKSLAGNLGERFVMVNIPGAEIEAVENGQVATRYGAVVGKPDRPSPVQNAKIQEINFNPFWHVPASIVRKDLIAKMQEDPQYLTRNKIRMYDGRGNEVNPLSIDWRTDQATKFLFRQDPWAENSMGTVRINMPNPNSTYMHDTPNKNLFGQDFRFHSSGCVRIQNIREILVWLLKDNPGWDRARIEQAQRSGERTDVKLTKPVPVYWVYITAWATPDGVVHFRPDIYNHGGIGQATAALAASAAVTRPVSQVASPAYPTYRAPPAAPTANSAGPYPSEPDLYATESESYESDDSEPYYPYSWGPHYAPR